MSSIKSWFKGKYESIKTWLLIKLVRKSLKIAYDNVPLWFSDDSESNPEATKSKMRQFLQETEPKKKRVRMKPFHRGGR